MDDFKDFLDKSWNAKMSREKMEYFPIGNTCAVDFFYNLDPGPDLDVLCLGAGKLT